MSRKWTPVPGQWSRMSGKSSRMLGKSSRMLGKWSRMSGHWPRVSGKWACAAALALAGAVAPTVPAFASPSATLAAAAPGHSSIPAALRSPPATTWWLACT